MSGPHEKVVPCKGAPNCHHCPACTGHSPDGDLCVGCQEHAARVGWSLARFEKYWAEINYRERVGVSNMNGLAGLPCPKCRGQMLKDGDELVCVNCGLRKPIEKEHTRVGTRIRDARPGSLPQFAGIRPYGKRDPSREFLPTQYLVSPRGTLLVIGK